MSRRLMAVAAVVMSGCGLEAVHEGLRSTTDRARFQEPFDGGSTFVDDGLHQCGDPELLLGEPGDPIHTLLSPEGTYVRPTCDIVAMNRPSVSAAIPGHGVDAPTSELVAVAQAMVGQWSGTRTTRWDGTHPVLLTFFPNGRYSFASLDESKALYYGEACGYHRSYWRIDTGSRALAAGELQINFEISNSCTVEWMKHIQVNDTALQFDQWHFEQYGPIHFELTRVSVSVQP